MSSHETLLKRVSLIENGVIVTPNEVIEGGSITIEDGKISDVLRSNQGTFKEAKYAGTFDVENRFVVPGLIDIHTHGLRGGSALDGTAQSILKMAISFPRYGVTGFLPTTVAEPNELLVSTARAIAAIVAKGTNSNSAEVLGMNLEGPFISKIKSGAQPVSSIREPDTEEFNKIFNESKGTLKLVTVAPELRGALDFIRNARKIGVTVAAGHSNATYEEMIAGIDAGITHVSHTFNAMREFRQRDPGIIAATLVRDEVTAELIADNVHVHEGAMKLLIKAKGPSKVVLISDSNPLAGMRDGKYDLMGFKVEKKDNAITLPSGQLAASAVTLDKSLKVAVNQLGLPLKDAVRMITANPARVVKVDDRKGTIAKGKDADLTILDENNLSVYATIIKGRIAFHSDN